MIIPSIDLMDGKAVQLIQGRQKVLERSDVEDLARAFNRYGEVAVIDLDAAMGRGNNEHLIRKIAKIADVRIGGGIRSEEKANKMLSLGARKVIVGTKAEPNFLSAINPERLIVAVDSLNQEVMTHGWRKSGGVNITEKIEDVESYCSEFLVTDIGQEGRMSGANLALANAVRGMTDNDITFAGGITTVEEIVQLENWGVSSQIGMAIYTDHLDLPRAFCELMDFSKGHVPTIVKDVSGRVLMQAFSTKESLRQALQSGQGIYYSRSRSEVWKKGETSGNTQSLLKARYDCDRDSIIFTVEQIGNACHKSRYSCFQEEYFTIDDLYVVIENRISRPSADSYTSLLAKSEEAILAKIKEEAQEVLNYQNTANLTWEIADLMYFLLVLMAKKNVTPQDVRNELWRRRK